GPVTGAVFVGYNRVLTSGADGRLVLWDSGSGVQVRVIEAHRQRVRYLGSVARGRHVVSASSREIKVWDARTLAPFATIRGLRRERAAPGEAAGEPQPKAVGADGSWVIYRGEPAPMVSAVALAGSPSRVAYALSPPKSPIVLWDAEHEAVVAVIEGAATLVRSLAFSPSGDRVAAGLVDGRVIVWQVRERVAAPEGVPARGGRTRAQVEWRECEPRELCSFDARGAATALAFTPEGSRIVSGSADQTAKMWGIPSGELIQTYADGHSDWLTSIAVRGNGKRLVTGSRDGVARLWNLETGEPIRSYRGHEREVTSVFLNGGGLLTASADGSARLWKTGTGWEQRAFRDHVAPSSSGGMSLDGRRLLTVGGSGPAILWDLDTGAAARSFPRIGGRWLSSALNADASVVALGGAQGEVGVWDAISGEAVLESVMEKLGWPLGPPPKFIGGGRQLAVPVHEGALGLIDVDDPSAARMAPPMDDRPDATVGTYGRVGRGSLLSGDGTVSCSREPGGEIAVWDAATGDSKARWPQAHPFTVLHAINYDGSRLLGRDIAGLCMWDATDGTLFETLRGAVRTPAVSTFSDDGTMLVTASFVPDASGGSRPRARSVVRVWSAACGTLIRELPVAVGRISLATFTRDNRRLILVARNTLRVIDVGSGTEVASLTPSSRDISDASVSHDGTTVVTVTDNGVIDVWR
ncbi:MAG: WD40 repeat domain-containing protein, partial [Candidatus Poribacteria bacterium]